MTTFVPFNRQPGQQFTFQAILDNQAYQIAVTWNVFGQRWYVNCIAANGTIVFTVPLIGSPGEGDINLAAGYFVISSLIYRASTQQFEVHP
jgi:hypothetical protein